MKMLFKSLLRNFGHGTPKTLAHASTQAQLMAESRARFDADDLVRAYSGTWRNWCSRSPQ